MDATSETDAPLPADPSVVQEDAPRETALDTVWWASGNLWNDAAVLSLVQSATGVSARIVHQGREGDWTGLAMISFGEEQGRRAVVHGPQGERSLHVTTLRVSEAGGELTGVENNGNVWLTDWERAEFPHTHVPEDQPAAASVAVPGQAEQAFTVLGEVENLPNIDASIAPPKEWGRIQLFNQDATFAWRWRAPAERNEGQAATITLRVRPVRVGGSGRISPDMLLGVMLGQLQGVLAEEKLGPVGEAVRDGVEWNNRHWIRARVPCVDAAGQARVLIFNGFAGRQYLHHFTLLTDEAQEPALRQAFDQMLSSYTVPD